MAASLILENSGSSMWNVATPSGFRFVYVASGVFYQPGNRHPRGDADSVPLLLKMVRIYATLARRQGLARTSRVSKASDLPGKTKLYEKKKLSVRMCTSWRLTGRMSKHLRERKSKRLISRSNPAEAFIMESHEGTPYGSKLGPLLFD